MFHHWQNNLGDAVDYYFLMNSHNLDSPNVLMETNNKGGWLNVDFMIGRHGEGGWLNVLSTQTSLFLSHE